MFSEATLDSALQAAVPSLMSADQAERFKQLLSDVKDYETRGGCGSCFRFYSTADMKGGDRCPHCNRAETKFDMTARFIREGSCSQCGRPADSPTEPCYCFAPSSPVYTPNSPSFAPTTPSYNSENGGSSGGLESEELEAMAAYMETLSELELEPKAKGTKRKNDAKNPPGEPRAKRARQS